MRRAVRFLGGAVAAVTALGMAVSAQAVGLEDQQRIAAVVVGGIAAVTGVGVIGRAEGHAGPAPAA